MRDNQRKLDDALALKTHLLHTTATFRKYGDAGLQLCQSMKNLSESFQKFPEFEIDATFQGVSKVLLDVQDVFERHYSSIMDMIQPIKEFVEVDIKRAEDDAKKASREYDSYMKLVEQYVWPPSASNKKKTPPPDISGQVQMAYWQAVRADFDFTRSLTILDHKRLLEMAITFISFVQMTSVCYH
jgi:hypothetical protein